MDHGSTETTRVEVNICGKPETSPILNSPNIAKDASVNLVRTFLATGDEQDFYALAQEIVPRLLRYCRALGSSGEDSEDIAQDVLYTVYSKAATVREPRSFWPWLFRVTRNAQLQQIRRANRQLPADHIELYEESKMYAVGTPSVSSISEFSGWLEALESGERDAIVLRYVEDFEYHEIAQALSIPIGTVKSRLFNAKKRLAKQIKELQTTKLPRGEAVAGEQM